MSLPLTAPGTSSSLSAFSTMSNVDPMTLYLQSLMKQRVAVICSSLGWQTIQGSCLQILVDLLARYVKTLGVEMQRRAECCNRTEANLFDVQRVFSDIGINMKELEDYVDNFDTKGPVGKRPVAQFPAPSDNNLNFLKPGSREVLHRKVHINEYFPPMFPELEDDNRPPSIVANDIVRGSSSAPEAGVNECERPSPQVGAQEQERDTRGCTSDDCSEFLEPMPPMPDVQQEVKKELAMTIVDGTSSEVISHLRDIPSVMMTSAGFISPAREGKLPESRTPHGGAAAAAAAALRQEREEEMRSLQRLQKKAMMAKEEERRQMASGASGKSETVEQTTPADLGASAQGSVSSPENRKKLAIFQKKSSCGTAQKPKKLVSSVKVAPDGAKVTSPIGTGKKSSKAVSTKKASSFGGAAMVTKSPAASTKVASTTPATATQGQQALRKKRGKAPVPISAEIVPDSPPSSPSPPPPHAPPSASEVKLEENVSLTLPPPPPPQPPPAQKSSSTVDNPLIPRVANFYGFDMGTGSGSNEKPLKNEKVKMKEKKKKSKKEKLRDKKKKIPKIERWSSTTSSATATSSSPTEIPSTSVSKLLTTAVPKITFKGIGNETRKQELEKKVVIKPVVPPSSSKADKKRRQIGGGANEDGDAYHMMFKEPLKIDRPTARSVEQRKARKLHNSGGKNASPSTSQAPTAKRRKTVETDPSSGTIPMTNTAVDVASSSRRKHASTSEEIADNSSSGKAGGGGGITVTQPVGHYVDDDGKEIWICPACGEQYNHLPMICCDRCDEWYHWMCVGISKEPDESQDWYCMRCVAEIKKENNCGKKNIREKKKR